MPFLKVILGFIIDRVLKFAYDKLIAFVKREKQKKETNEKIDNEEAAKLEALKKAETESEVENAFKNSAGNS